MEVINLKTAKALGLTVPPTLLARLSYEAGGLGALVAEIRQASENVTAGDARMNQRLDGIERSVNELYLKYGRPGTAWESKDDDIAERKDAMGLCYNRRALTVPKIDADVADNYTPTSTEVDQALIHRKAVKTLFRHGDTTRLEPTFQKSLSAFSFGASGFLLAPEQSNQVLRCIVDPTDVSGLVNCVNISAPSIRFPIDNARMLTGGWACEAGCFANNPQPDLSEGLGQLEIKAESLRFVVCATSDLLQDASFNVESWLLEKVSRGFRDTINYSILLGDGVGKPLGFLSPHAGIPICDTSNSTPPGQFSWQDLLMLKMEIPNAWQDGAVFLMNSRTAALLFTMSTAEGRPLFSASLPERGPGFMFAGSPIIICTWMPDVAAGSTPVMFGNLRSTYMLVDRQALTMDVDRYTAGFCTLFKFECRIGGAITCPNASRLLRIR